MNTIPGLEEKRQSIFFCVSVSVVVMLTLMGCASKVIDEQAFADYHKAVLEVRTASRIALDYDNKWDKYEFIAESYTDAAKLSQLEIPNENNTPVYKEDAPLYAKVEAQVRIFNSVTEALEKYSTLLSAASDGISIDKYKALAEDCDTSFRNAIQAIKQKNPQAGNDSFTFLSPKMFEMIEEGNKGTLRNQEKERDALLYIMKSAQPRVDFFCSQCHQILKDMDGPLRSTYEKRFASLRDKFTDMCALPSPSSEEFDAKVEQFKKNAKQRIIIGKVVELNENYISSASILKEAKFAYSKEGIPNAHAALMQSLIAKNYNRNVINNLFASANRLKGCVNEAMGKKRMMGRDSEIWELDGMRHVSKQ